MDNNLVPRPTLYSFIPQALGYLLNILLILLLPSFLILLFFLTMLIEYEGEGGDAEEELENL